jgi:hypothetical protein
MSRTVSNGRRSPADGASNYPPRLSASVSRHIQIPTRAHHAAPQDRSLNLLPYALKNMAWRLPDVQASAGLRPPRIQSTRKNHTEIYRSDANWVPDLDQCNYRNRTFVKVAVLRLLTTTPDPSKRTLRQHSWLEVLLRFLCKLAPDLFGAANLLRRPVDPIAGAPLARTPRVNAHSWLRSSARQPCASAAPAAWQPQTPA